MAFCWSRELPHCCEVRTLLGGEQDGSSRAMKLIREAEGACVIINVLSTCTLLCDLGVGFVCDSKTERFPVCHHC